jgi:D,D-heptose 1,7-bisphosphate phosphatase
VFSPAIFLDQEGIVTTGIPAGVDTGQMCLVPGGAEGLRFLSKAGYLLVVISNQPGVALGYFNETAVMFVEKHLRFLFMTISVPLVDFYYCPHHPQGIVASYKRMACICRRPAPGLIFRAAFEHKIDLARSWFIGETLDDIEAGHRAGCKTILIDNGYETSWQFDILRQPEYLVADFRDAARKILLSSRADSDSVLERSW